MRGRKNKLAHRYKKGTWGQNQKCSPSFSRHRRERDEQDQKFRETEREGRFPFCLNTLPFCVNTLNVPRKRTHNKKDSNSNCVCDKFLVAFCLPVIYICGYVYFSSARFCRLGACYFSFSGKFCIKQTVQQQVDLTVQTYFVRHCQIC